MITESKKILPAYVYTEGGTRCFLSLNADIHGKWSVGYAFLGQEVADKDGEVAGELTGFPAEFPCFNDCETVQEALDKMADALKETA